MRTRSKLLAFAAVMIVAAAALVWAGWGTRQTRPSSRQAEGLLPSEAQRELDLGNAGAARLEDAEKESEKNGKPVRPEEWDLPISHYMAAFKEALADPRVLYRLGLAHDKAGHELAAIAWFEAYLAANPNAANAAAVRKEIIRLEDATEAKIADILRTARANAERIVDRTKKDQTLIAIQGMISETPPPKTPEDPKFLNQSQLTAEFLDALKQNNWAAVNRISSGVQDEETLQMSITAGFFNGWRWESYYRDLFPYCGYTSERPRQTLNQVKRIPFPPVRNDLLYGIGWYAWFLKDDIATTQEALVLLEESNRQAFRQGPGDDSKKGRSPHEIESNPILAQNLRDSIASHEVEHGDIKNALADAHKLDSESSWTDGDLLGEIAIVLTSNGDRAWAKEVADDILALDPGAAPGRDSPRGGVRNRVLIIAYMIEGREEQAYLLIEDNDKFSSRSHRHGEFGGSDDKDECYSYIVYIKAVEGDLTGAKETVLRGKGELKKWRTIIHAPTVAGRNEELGFYTESALAIALARGGDMRAALGVQPDARWTEVPKLLWPEERTSVRNLLKSQRFEEAAEFVKSFRLCQFRDEEWSSCFAWNRLVVEVAAAQGLSGDAPGARKTWSCLNRYFLPELAIKYMDGNARAMATEVLKEAVRQQWQHPQYPYEFGQGFSRRLTELASLQEKAGDWKGAAMTRSDRSDAVGPWVATSFKLSQDEDVVDLKHAIEKANASSSVAMNEAWVAHSLRSSLWDIRDQRVRTQ